MGKPSAGNTDACGMAGSSQAYASQHQVTQNEMRHEKKLVSAIETLV